jgi:Flp pilus assembly protein TadB
MTYMPKLVRKLAILIAGSLLLLVGAALLVLPGPGLLVIALGLFVLSLEFEWADRYFQRVKKQTERLNGPLKKRLNKRSK